MAYRASRPTRARSPSPAGALPADGNPTFATSTSSSAGLHHGTSGSGATEEYILECALADTPDLVRRRHLSADLHGHRSRRGRYGHLGDLDRQRQSAYHDVHGAGLRRDVRPRGSTGRPRARRRLLQPGLRLGQRRQLPGVHHPEFRHPALGRHGGHLAVQLARPARRRQRVRDGRGVRARVRDHRDAGLSDNGTYHATFLATGGANGAPEHHFGNLTITSPSRLRAGTSGRPTELLLGHQGRAVLRRHRGQRRPARPDRHQAGAPAPCR